MRHTHPGWGLVLGSYFRGGKTSEGTRFRLAPQWHTLRGGDNLQPRRAGAGRDLGGTQAGGPSTRPDPPQVEAAPPTGTRQQQALVRPRRCPLQIEGAQVIKGAQDDHALPGMVDTYSSMELLSVQVTEAVSDAIDE